MVVDDRSSIRCDMRETTEVVESLGDIFTRRKSDRESISCRIVCVRDRSTVTELLEFVAEGIILECDGVTEVVARVRESSQGVVGEGLTIYTCNTCGTLDRALGEAAFEVKGLMKYRAIGVDLLGELVG